MSSLATRAALVSASVLSVFAVVAAVLLQVVPGPHGPADYLVIGSVATLAALSVLFVVTIAGWVKMRDIFYRRRRKSGS
jgi:hypothetical protein